MSPEQLTVLLGDVIQTTMDYSASWQRGNKAKREANAKRRAVDALFHAITGQKPTEAEHDAMNTRTASVY